MNFSAVARQKLPPFGSELLKARSAGRPVNPWLFCGRRAWEVAARRGPGRLVLPPGEDPRAFNWRPIAGLDLVVTWHEASAREADALGRLLVLAGARSVHVLDGLLIDPRNRQKVVGRRYRRYVWSDGI